MDDGQKRGFRSLLGVIRSHRNNMATVWHKAQREANHYCAGNLDYFGSNDCYRHTSLSPGSEKLTRPQRVR